MESEVVVSRVAVAVVDVGSHSVVISDVTEVCLSSVGVTYRFEMLSRWSACPLEYEY